MMSGYWPRLAVAVPDGTAQIQPCVAPRSLASVKDCGIKAITDRRHMEAHLT
jgi:hypothetical protein